LFNEAIALIREIQRVEKRLDSIYEEGLAEPVSEVAPAIPFESLQCTALTFSYRDERGQSSFSIEPLDFQLSRGELVSIAGGNGKWKVDHKVIAGLSTVERKHRSKRRRCGRRQSAELSKPFLQRTKLTMIASAVFSN
jgi:ABC-type siderophore export system fused ATPase/permease subunit